MKPAGVTLDRGEWTTCHAAMRCCGWSRAISLSPNGALTVGKLVHIADPVTDDLHIHS